ncbi:MAG: F0F1 ATP synthase subunit delta [Candidatus Curtissbacteria bacterium]
MKSKKKYIRIAKKMLEASLKNGQVDSKLTHRVLSVVISQKPYRLSHILKLFRRLVAQKLAWEEIVMETATLPSFNKSAFLKKTDAKRIVTKINPELIVGAKITHGDWVWEQTLNSKLEQIKNS